MENSRVNVLLLVGVLIAGFLALNNAHPIMSSLAGLTLLVTLVAFDDNAVRDGLQSLAFALVSGVALVCTLSYPVSLLFAEPGAGSVPGFVGKNALAIIWLAGALILWLVDRARMNSRQSYSLGSAVSAGPLSFQAPPQAPPPRPFVATPQPAPYVPPAPPTTPVEQPQPMPVAATPDRPRGKEATIYVNMLNEGMSVLRPVRAESLGRDFYIIVEDMPADESWQYTTGQVVRCQKKNLSNGKGLVAFEEAPRAQ